MKEFALAILLLLTVLSCAPKVVQVPVPIQCFDSAMLPVPVESASLHVQKTDTDGEKIKQILIEREQLRASDNVFRALFGGCSL